MANAKTVSREWGALASDAPLTAQQIEEKARGLLTQMTLTDKIGQMSGDQSFILGGLGMLRGYNRTWMSGGENKRLNIPGIRFTDGPRGVAMGHSTCFPVSMARGATWDPELEARVGDAMGVEARAQGANFFGGVCINLLRHPAWGRAQETYGEDPFLLGEMGAALLRGVQRHVMACVKHYALNSMEDMRFKVNVRVGERTLREIYLPHFRRCVDQGVAAVMSAYNQVNGAYCGENRRLLRKILKEEWAFAGFVISDFVWGIYNAERAANAGLDLEMPFKRHYHRNLKGLVEQGKVPLAAIDQAVMRLLRRKIQFAQVGEPERYTREALASEAHRALAREVGYKSIVLLKNDPVDGAPVLPIDRARVKRIALIGKLADQPNIGDNGSSRVHPPYVVTPRQGIENAIGNSALAFDDGSQIARAAASAQPADVAIVVCGCTSRDEGENMGPGKGGDRALLTLHAHDEALIQAVARLNPKTVVVLIGGSAFVTEAWRQQVPAILMAWYPGMEGGNALADILFGKANPSAKLPCVFPKSDSQLAFFDRKAREIEYGYYHGYRLMDKQGKEPAFPFGFGLSYTTFQFANLQVDATSDPIRISVEVKNTGDCAGDEVVQLYIGYDGSSVDRPVKELKGFARVTLAPAEVKEVNFALPMNQLAYYDTVRKGWVVEPIRYRAYVGSSSAARDLLQADWEWKPL